MPSLRRCATTRTIKSSRGTCQTRASTLRSPKCWLSTSQSARRSPRSSTSPNTLPSAALVTSEPSHEQPHLFSTSCALHSSPLLARSALLARLRASLPPPFWMPLCSLSTLLDASTLAFPILLDAPMPALLHKCTQPPCHEPHRRAPLLLSPLTVCRAPTWGKIPAT